MTAAAHARPTGRTLRNPLPALAKSAGRRLGTVARAVKGNQVTIRSATLQIGSLGLFVASAAGFDWRAGTAVAGVCGFVLNWLLTDVPDGRR